MSLWTKNTKVCFLGSKFTTSALTDTTNIWIILLFTHRPGDVWKSTTSTIALTFSMHFLVFDLVLTCCLWDIPYLWGEVVILILDFNLEVLGEKDFILNLIEGLSCSRSRWISKRWNFWWIIMTCQKGWTWLEHVWENPPSKSLIWS